MQFGTLALVVTLAACTDEEVVPPPLVKSGTDASASTAVSASTGSVNLASADVSARPWQDLVTLVSTGGDADSAAAMSAVLDARAEVRKIEALRLDGSMVSLETRLSQTCDARELEETFVTYQKRESDALQADRVMVGQLLDLAGSEGRVAVWTEPKGIKMLLEPRSDLAEASYKTLPNWVGASPDASDEDKTRGRRMLLALNYASEAANIETQATLAEAELGIARLDASDPAAVGVVISSLEAVDGTLIDGQRSRFDKLLGACRELEDEQWLTLLTGDQVGTFIGNLGGLTSERLSNASAQAKTGGQQGGMQGGQQGGMQGGQQGGMQGGTQGGMQGGMQGGKQGGMQGGQQGGMQGGTQGGMQGGTQGGTQGGMQGGTQGGMQGGTQGGMQGGTQGGGQQGGPSQGGSTGGPGGPGGQGQSGSR